MRLNDDSLSGVGLPVLVDRWSRLREHAAQLHSPVPLVADGLPLRARRLVDDTAALTVQELLAMNPEELIRRDNVGRTTLAALVSRAEESLPPVTVDFEAPDFVEAVDGIVGTLVD